MGKSATGQQAKAAQGKDVLNKLKSAGIIVAGAARSSEGARLSGLPRENVYSKAVFSPGSGGKAVKIGFPMNFQQPPSAGLHALRQVLLDRRRALQQSADWIARPAGWGIHAVILHPAEGSISIVQAQSEPPVLFGYLVRGIDRNCRAWNDVMISSGIKKMLNPPL